MQWIRDFCRDESGQDLVEYSLLITFIALASVAFIYNGQASIKTIWSQSNTELVAANNFAAGH
jgi:Flp pilus assembly pilin Flp